METEEPWELFDLEADLQVTLSEDGKVGVSFVMPSAVGA